MGIAKAAAQMLMREGQRCSLAGRVLTLGRQDIHLSVDLLRQTAAVRGYPLAAVPAHVPPSKAYHLKHGHLSDRSFFQMLGFSEVHSLDVSDYEGASEIFDLNSTLLPHHLEGAFDFVLDGGT